MKKLYLSLFALVAVTAMLAGATMAWFTATDNAGEAVFTAGTVNIEADSTVIMSQFFDPSGATYLYGVEANTGHLYEIDVKNGSVHNIFETNLAALSPTDLYSPNGLAFDRDSRRLYFSIKKGGNSDLWFYDFFEKELIYSGRMNSHTIYGATFGMGHYWYMNNGTDALYKVPFNVDGTARPREFVANITGDLNKRFTFGDVVMDIRDGIIYGSSSGSTSNQEFFTYDIATNIYQKVDQATALNLQLAFGSDGKLYGHHTRNKLWYEIDTATGDTTTIAVAGGRSFNDLASGYTSVWNPGDSSKMRYTVVNTGSKGIHVRAQLTGQWVNSSGIPQPQLVPAVVEIDLCSSDWFYEGGYFYYDGSLAAGSPGESAELCVTVTLNGPNTGNDYQGMSFILTGTMEAIQSSNGASLAVWNVTIPTP